MSDRKKALGRGLSALLPKVEQDLLFVPVDQLQPNPFQPRRDYPAEELAPLVESIRQHGMLQPIVVSPIEGAELSGVPRYYVIAGERRWRAAVLAGLTTIPAVLRSAKPSQMLELALIENLQRENLNPIEVARAYQRLIDEFGFTQESIAGAVGKSRSAVANALRLLRLPAEVQKLLAEGQLTEGHARALIGLPAERALALARLVVVKGLSVREVEELARQATAPTRTPGPRKREKQPDVFTHALEEALRQRLGTKVTLHRGAHGGRIVIHFYSDEELQAIVQAIASDLEI